MKQKTIKILTMIIMSILLISISINSFAADNATLGGFNPKSIKANDSVQGGTQITSVGSSIVGILQVVGIVLSVVILIVLGIKYMMGSSEEKAEYKKTMLPYFIGAIILFAAVNIAKVIVNMSNTLTESLETGAVVTREIDEKLV